MGGGGQGGGTGRNDSNVQECEGHQELRLGREGKSCIKLTLSGTQENFSEIIKGTPSIAAKEKKREKGIIDTTMLSN